MNQDSKKKLMILMVDDDEDYFYLSQQALKKSGCDAEIKWLCDGEECMKYLMRREPYTNPVDNVRPDVILMDMNMPRKNGLETLREIKASPELKNIPVAMLTISRAEDHITRSYEMGANSFITKPLEFNKLIESIKTFVNYWQSVVSLSKK